MEKVKEKYAECYQRTSQTELEGETQQNTRRRYFADLSSSGGPRTFDIVLAGTEPDSSSKDYLTWYYCDFLEAEPVGPAPPFSDNNTTSVEELIAWLQEFKPRTRMDAYPMLQVAVVALNKIIHKEVLVRSQQAETLIRLK
jgi:hypothetical protein